MESYEVMKGLLQLIDSQIDCVIMRLPVDSVEESEVNYNTINIKLKEGSSFSIHVSRLKDGVMV